MKKRTIKYIALILLLSIAGVGTTLYYRQSHEVGPIYVFNEDRDTQSILDIFKSDWYWLVASSDYSPRYMLTYRAPNQNPLDRGKLIIKVLREQEEFIGFTAYYKKSPTVWQLLFVAVKDAMRGKRYGETLVRYALEDMRSKGACRVELVTRTTNLSAQKLYLRMGFKETEREEGYVYFAYMY